MVNRIKVNENVIIAGSNSGDKKSESCYHFIKEEVYMGNKLRRSSFKLRIKGMILDKVSYKLNSEIQNEF